MKTGKKVQLIGPGSHEPSDKPSRREMMLRIIELISDEELTETEVSKILETAEKIARQKKG